MDPQALDPELYNFVIYGSGSFSFCEKIKGAFLEHELTSQGNSLLHVAAKSGKKKIAEEILNNSQSSLMYMTNSEGNTALHIAASLGHLEMKQLLINRAKDYARQQYLVPNELLRMVNLDKDTALHGAVRNGCYEIVDILIEEEPNLVLSINSAGESPLFLAVDRGFYEIALHILKIIPKCSRERRNKIYEGSNKMNVLHVAAIRTHKYKGKVSSTALALLNHSFNIINQFLPAGLKLSCSKSESTRKFKVTGADFVRELLNNRLSTLLEKDDFGWIPLHHAVHAGNAKVVELFLEIFIQKKNEIFSEMTFQKQNELSSESNHHLACITDEEGMSALHISANKGHVHVMRTLIAKCPEICELFDSRGRTALHVAVESGKSGAVQILLETVAFQDLINKQDKEGNTPLHLAAVKGSSSLLKMLAKNRKVDKLATNKKGMTAIDIVSSNMQRLKQEDIDTGIEETFYMLKWMGCLPSLQQGVTRETNKRHGQSQQTETKDEAVKDMAKTTHQENESLNRKGKTSERSKNMANINLLIVTIIATVTFAAGIALPAGYNTSIDSLQTSSRNSTSSLRPFVVSNSLAFGCSSASMFLHFMLSLLPGVFGGLYPKQFITILTEFALVGMIVAFTTGTFVFFPKDSGLTLVVLVSTLIPFLFAVFYPSFAMIIKAFKKYYCVGRSIW